MILSDRDLRKEIEAGRLKIEPYDPSALQPSSIDLRVAEEFRVFANHKYPFIDVRKPMDELTEVFKATEQEPFILHPGEFVLASTLETVSLPNDLVARLEGKSSLGRLGLLIHSTAGFIDSGWSGQLTLELSNVANLPIAIYPGMRVGQLCVFQMTSSAEHPYGSDRTKSKYQGQRGPTPSRYYENFEGE